MPVAIAWNNGRGENGEHRRKRGRMLNPFLPPINYHHIEVSLFKIAPQKRRGKCK